MKTIAVIPAYNEEKHICAVVESVKNFVDEIIVVNDGSNDRTAELAKQRGAKVFNHLINRGLGGSLATGFKAALASNADLIVTLDADGQHKADEIPKLLKPIIENEADVVIGSRFINFQKMPFFRRIGNYFFNIITLLLFGAWTSDSQSGMRAFNRKAVEKLDIFNSGMGVSSEIIKEIKSYKLRLKEVPITAIYTPYSLSKGQGFIMGIKTLIKLIFLKLNK